MKKLERDFYKQDTLKIAEDLLGKYLIRYADGCELVGKIVETEAYMGPIDKASHAYKKRTDRNEVMYGPPGFAYVYLIYGMYCCLNIVTGDIDVPHAILIRALEPINGLEVMARNRYNKEFLELNKKSILNLTNGPGKLCMAFGINRKNNGDDLCSESFYIAEDNKNEEFSVVTTTRVNIDYAKEARDFPWRFYINGNPYVSQP